MGSKPAFSFTGSATYNTGTLTSSASATITMNPPVGGTKVLAVVGNPRPSPGRTRRSRTSFEDNFAITYVDDNTASPRTSPATTPS